MTNNIEKLREAAGYTQARLGAIIGVHKNTVANWEKGGEVKSSNLIQLSELFNVSPTQLLGLEPLPVSEKASGEVA